MMTTQASMGNQTMKVKRQREGGFCVTLFFWVLFNGGSFFSHYIFVKPRIFFSSPRIWLLLTN
jgi:hypothetical protein